MKKLLVFPLILASALMLRAQEPPAHRPPVATAKSLEFPPEEAPSAPPRHPGFSSFNINFLGGPPAKLVQMITNQIRKPVNVIIPPEHSYTELPPLNLNGVTVPQLFEALGEASRRTVTYVTGSISMPGGYQQYQRGTTGFGFKTTGPLREDSIWYFFVENSGEPPKPPPAFEPKKPTVCRFFQLGPYLEGGTKVEDITTALETAWKMMGATTAAPAPEIKFHQDTKLLIAVGQPDRLLLIDEVLEKLPDGLVRVDPQTGLPVAPSGGIGGVKSPENINTKPARP